jgi:hypothetical protein
MDVGSTVAVIARLVLAAALSFAAVAKLRAREVAREQTVVLVGDALGPAVASALPFVELAIAVMLLIWWSAVPGVVAALLLVAFTAVVVRAEVRHLPCPCFGRASATVESGPAAVLRNAVLLVCAVFATGAPR